MSSANTFGTFLETFRKLESSRTSASGTGWPEKEVLLIAQTLHRRGNNLPLSKMRYEVELSQESFLGALLAGRDKGLFHINEEPDEPEVKLTKLGMSFVS